MPVLVCVRMWACKHVFTCVLAIVKAWQGRGLVQTPHYRPGSSCRRSVSFLWAHNVAAAALALGAGVMDGIISPGLAHCTLSDQIPLQMILMTYWNQVLLDEEILILTRTNLLKLIVHEVNYVLLNCNAELCTVFSIHVICGFSVAPFIRLAAVVNHLWVWKYNYFL